VGVKGTVDFPYELKIHVSKISDDNSPKHSYHFVSLNKDNGDNPSAKFIPAFFSGFCVTKKGNRE
jgi:hypothetical protein